MKHIKFKSAGKWAEHDPSLPQFEVKKDEVREVSNELADIIVGAGRGEIVKAPKPKNPPKDDKAEAEGTATPPEADKAKAETGKGKGKDK